MEKNEFSDAIKIKCLLCCDRHCCLCGQQCATKIVIHHIEGRKRKGTNLFDNAMPLCFVCHAEVEFYNKEHPLGSKYNPKELRERRNQIYDKYTSPFVPNIHFEIKSYRDPDKPKDEPHKPTDARFHIFNTHQYLGCKVKLVFSIYNQSTKKKIHEWKDDIYGGENSLEFKS